MLYKKMIEARIEQAKKKLDTFAENLKKDPLHALRWSINSFEAAAELHVWTEIQKDVIENSIGLFDVVRHMKEEALKNSQCSYNSTNPTANILDQCKLNAYAKALFDLLKYPDAIWEPKSYENKK